MPINNTSARYIASRARAFRNTLAHHKHALKGESIWRTRLESNPRSHQWIN